MNKLHGKLLVGMLIALLLLALGCSSTPASDSGDERIPAGDRECLGADEVGALGDDGELSSVINQALAILDAELSEQDWNYLNAVNWFDVEPENILNDRVMSAAVKALSNFASKYRFESESADCVANAERKQALIGQVLRALQTSNDLELRQSEIGGWVRTGIAIVSTTAVCIGVGAPTVGLGAGACVALLAVWISSEAHAGEIPGGGLVDEALYESLGQDWEFTCPGGLGHPCCEGVAVACETDGRNGTLVCGPDRNCRSGQTGDPCTDNSHCGEWYVCGPHGVCVAGEEGDPCIDDAQCAENCGDMCVCNQHGYCSYPQVGNPCQSSQECGLRPNSHEPMYCVDGRCRAGEAGDPCTSDEQCVWEDSVCRDGYCSFAPGFGHTPTGFTCSNDHMCQLLDEDSVCVGGRCTPGSGVGTHSTSAYDSRLAAARAFHQCSEQNPCDSAIFGGNFCVDGWCSYGQYPSLCNSGSDCSFGICSAAGTCAAKYKMQHNADYGVCNDYWADYNTDHANCGGVCDSLTGICRGQSPFNSQCLTERFLDDGYCADGAKCNSQSDCVGTEHGNASAKYSCGPHGACQRGWYFDPCTEDTHCDDRYYMCMPGRNICVNKEHVGHTGWPCGEHLGEAGQCDDENVCIHEDEDDDFGRCRKKNYYCNSDSDCGRGICLTDVNMCTQGHSGEPCHTHDDCHRGSCLSGVCQPPVGAQCESQDGCKDDHFCGPDGLCHEGKTGDRCTTFRHCGEGYMCDLGAQICRER